MDGAYIRCLMVETGQERIVQQLLTVRKLGRSLYPQRVKIVRRRGKWRKTMIRLLPGYIFVYTDEEVPVWKYQGLEHVLKVLRYDKEPHGYLKGYDYEFARTVSDLDGKLELLEAVDENGLIRITDMLAETLHAEILKVEKRTRLVKLKVELLGQERIMYMNYQLMDANGKPIDPVTEMLEDENDEWLTAWTPDFADDLAEELDREAQMRWREAENAEPVSAATPGAGNPSEGEQPEGRNPEDKTRKEGDGEP